ncbi:hypothetical protein MTR_4g052260 [Medicago truncatula]|uniref:Uncharacterized protein n=1 Tax=Medicago truncatula TaxID=3880 RepID=A0A072UJG1_MEDTR|nr:hypothetical protein MTR_4g052260 [Medicago truncatula]
MVFRQKLFYIYCENVLRSCGFGINSVDFKNDPLEGGLHLWGKIPEKRTESLEKGTFVREFARGKSTGKSARRKWSYFCSICENGDSNDIEKVVVGGGFVKGEGMMVESW